MKKRLLILIVTSLLLSGCAAQSYTASGGGVYLGNTGYSQSNLSVGAGFSSSAGWYGYPWFSAAYRQPVYPGYWPGYITAGYGFGRFYGGFNWNWGYFYPSPYYAYSGWGYNPYYGYRYAGYRPHRGHGPYRQTHNPHSGYAHAPYRNNRGPHNRGPHNSGQRHGNYGGFEYDRRDRNRHPGNGQRPHPRESTQPVRHQPVRVVRMPAHRSESDQPTMRSGRAAGAVRSGSGNSGWKAGQEPVERLHRATTKYSKPESFRSVKIVRKQARVVEKGVGYTPPRPYSAQRSASGPDKYKGGKPPRQQLHVSSKSRVQPTPTASHRQAKPVATAPHARPQLKAQPQAKKSTKATVKSHKRNSGKKHKKERKSRTSHVGH